MADTKISAMTPASLPLTGAETVALVQSGANVKATLDSVNSIITNHGYFYSMIDQTTAGDTEEIVELENTGFSQGISVVDDTKITIAKRGVYNLQFSFQLTNTGQQIRTASFWIKLNGSNYANSNTDIDVPSSHGGNPGKIVAAWSIMGIATAENDYVEIAWSATGSTVSIEHIDAQSNPTRPATPSAVVTLQQVAQYAS